MNRTPVEADAFARLETPRTVMAPPAVEDFAGIAQLWADAQVTRFIGGKPLGREECWSRLLRARGHWELMGYGYWTVRLKAGGRFVRISYRAQSLETIRSGGKGVVLQVLKIPGCSGATLCPLGRFEGLVRARLALAGPGTRH